MATVGVHVNSLVALKIQRCGYEKNIQGVTFCQENSRMRIGHWLTFSKSPDEQNQRKKKKKVLLETLTSS